jgi:hypothetical protein
MFEVMHLDQALRVRSTNWSPRIEEWAASGNRTVQAARPRIGIEGFVKSEARGARGHRCSRHRMGSFAKAAGEITDTHDQVPA